MVRKTRQRELIRELFLAHNGPYTPKEVYERAVESGERRIGVATVYRTINLLLEEGWLTRLHLFGETYYEPSERPHHHFFRCRCCNTVFGTVDCTIRSAVESAVPDGCVLESHELLLSGLCGRCACRDAEPAGEDAAS
jgi:Fur family ferric uptake transcriptional regulator